MATGQGRSGQPGSRRRAIVVAIALAAAFASTSASAGTEIALRFHDDNRAARGASLSPVAQAAIEQAAGVALVPLGRDADGAFRFGFALPRSHQDVRDALNRLRSTGALVYAEFADDDRTTLAKHAAVPPQDNVHALIVVPRATLKAAGAALPAGSRARIAQKAGIAIRETRSLSGGSQLLLLGEALSPAAADVALRAIASDPDVAHVEVDRRARIQAQPTDPLYVSQWNLSDPVGGIGAPRGWDMSTGDPGAPIAVLDTGILPHPDLAGRVSGGYDFIADANFSNDGDGRDPDPSDPGDFVTQAESTTPGSPLQSCPVVNSSWHGTMVAGTLGAAVNNGSGMTGVSWQNPLLNVRVLGKCGGALSDVADGIRWAAGLPVPGVPVNATPARVINLSLSGNGECGTILQSAVTAAVANGAIVVVAAGNNNDNVANHWPANCNGVITVAATSKNGSRAFYSNTGSQVAVAAPGGGIGGSIPVLRNSATTVPDPSGYIYGQQLGSSLAAPHVAGIAALALALAPNLTPAEVRVAIENGARAFPAVATDPCQLSTCGAGIADADITLSKLAPNGPTSPPPGRQPPPSSPTPLPSPVPTPGPEPLPPAAEAPPAGLAPVPGGWRAKAPGELARLLKRGRV